MHVLSSKWVVAISSRSYQTGFGPEVECSVQHVRALGTGRSRWYKEEEEEEEKEEEEEEEQEEQEEEEQEKNKR